MTSAWLALALGLGGCGGGDTMPDAGSIPRDGGGPPGDGGAAPDAGTPGADAGPSSDCSGIRTSADGVLTNHPELSFVNEGGPLVLRTAYLEVVERSTNTALILYGEIENTGTEYECTPLPDFYVGFTNLYPVVEGPAYNTSSSVSTTCLAPGERGVVSGIENGVGTGYLDSVTQVRYAMNARTETFFRPSTASRPTILDASPRTTGDETVIAGTGSTSRPIRNLSIAFLGRNACGLVWGEWTAYPEDFETNRIGTFSFETFPEAIRAVGVPVDWLAFSSFIDDDFEYTTFLVPETTRIEQEWTRRTQVRQRFAQFAGQP